MDRSRAVRGAYPAAGFYTVASDGGLLSTALSKDRSRRGFPLVVVDSNGPLAGVPGRYQAMKPKYYRGANRPRLGDAAFTERAVFGS